MIWLNTRHHKKGKKMEKGLSELQKKILIMGSRNPDGGVSSSEVLTEVYGFPVTGHGKMLFDRNFIGVKRYQSASVSVAKAFNRIASRGLAERKFNYGIKMTEAGWKVAKGLNG